MEKLNIVYDSMVYWKIMHWVQKANDEEVSGFGKVIKDGNTLRVVSATLLPQRNGKANTDIEGEDLGRAEYLLKDEPGELRLWWHSHVKMGVFWSHTDLETIKVLGKPGWIVATVFNQLWQKKSALYLGQEDVFIDDIETTNVFKLNEAMTAPWDADFKTNVTDVELAARAKKTASLFTRWRKSEKKQLTRREEEQLEAAEKKNDPIVGIFYTNSYGKVLFTEKNLTENGIWRPQKHNAGSMVRIFTREILQDTRHIKYATEEMCDDMEMLTKWGVGMAKNPVVEKFLEDRREGENGHPKHQAIPTTQTDIPNGDTDGQESFLRLPASSSEIPDEETEEDDAKWADDLYLKAMFREEWETMSEKEKNEYRALQRTGFWADEREILTRGGI